MFMFSAMNVLHILCVTELPVVSVHSVGAHAKKAFMYCTVNVQ